ncbi:hypothetical protein JCM3774_004326 [Rhodotorula dairenensis]
MWSRVAKLASPAPRKPAARLDSPLRTDQLFRSLRRVLGDGDGDTAGDSPARASSRADEAERLLGLVLQTLQLEAQSERAPPLGQALESILESNSLGQAVDLALDSGDPALRTVLLRWYAEAIDCLDGAWLTHSAIHKPLVKLFQTCLSLGGDLGRGDLELATLLCVVAERIRSTPDLLPVFFRRRIVHERLVDPASIRVSAADLNPPLSPTLSHASTSDASFPYSANSQVTGSVSSVSEYDCTVFTALVKYLHREADIGEAARTGLVALIDVARSSRPTTSTSRAAAFGGLSDERRRSTGAPAASTPVGEQDLGLTFAEWILESDLAEVLAASLGALYGALPNKLVIRPVGTSSAAALDSDSVSGNAPSAGMVLGGMGALQDDEDAETSARRREEEDELLQNQGYGLSGTVDFTRALDHFLRLFEFAQDMVERCTWSPVESLAGSQAAEADATERQRRLLLAAIASTIVAALRTSFLQGVLYPSILECSATDGSAVAVLSYLEIMLEILHDGSDFEAAVLAFLMGDDSGVEPSPAAARASAANIVRSPPPPHGARHIRQRSRGLVLLDRADLRTTVTASTEYYVSSDRFSLRDLLQTTVVSGNAATTTAALKLFKTIVAKHDRWSLALLDVEVDEFATAFPGVRFASLPAVAYEETPSRQDQDSNVEGEKEDDFVQTPRTPRPQARRASVPPPTPLSALRPLLDVGAPVTRSRQRDSLQDPLDVLLSLVGEIDPSCRAHWTARGGQGSNLVATGFSHYLHDAEAELARDRGFRRGIRSLADLPESEELASTCSSPGSPSKRRIGEPEKSLAPTSFELAATATGRRHRLAASSSLCSSLLVAFSAFFSHPPHVNLALTEALAALAISPYRALDGWCLPSEIQYSPPSPTWSSDLFAPSSSPLERADTAVVADSDSVLAVLQALAITIVEYRRRVPKFDDYLDDRRKGLFFADNLADALEGINLGSNANLSGDSVRMAAPPLPLLPVDPAPASKASSMTAGLVSLFSPRRPSVQHRRSPSTPNGFATPMRPGPGTTVVRPSSQLRRSVSDESLAPLSPTGRPDGADPSLGGSGATSKRVGTIVEDDRRQRLVTPGGVGGAAPASPFAAHYRETGSVQVRPILVATPSRAITSRTVAPFDGGLNGDADSLLVAAEEEEGPESPSKRLSPLPPTRSVDVDEEEHAAATHSSGRPAQGGTTVSLSTILDNVIVLEEFVKELAAIVYVRRALGIDPVRFVDT